MSTETTRPPATPLPATGSDLSDLVLLDVRDGYAVVTLNRPEKRNAMSRDAIRRLWQVLDEVADLRLKVVVLTGAGQVAFCAGADLKDTSPEIVTTARFLSAWHRTQDVISRHPAVFVAAVNGFALGGGLTLVNNCELAVAAETATFGMPEITFDAYPALAGPSTIQRILPKHAAEMILTGRRVDAAKALAWGLVNEVVPADQVLDRACALGAHVASFGAASLGLAKEALRSEYALDWDAALDHGSRTTAQLAGLRATQGAVS